MIFKKERVDGKVVLIPVLQEPGRGCMRMSFGLHYTLKDKTRNPQSQGDDTHFIFAEKNTIGVADGVGG